MHTCVKIYVYVDHSPISNLFCGAQTQIRPCCQGTQCLSRVNDSRYYFAFWSTIEDSDICFFKLNRNENEFYGPNGLRVSPRLLLKGQRWNRISHRNLFYTYTTYIICSTAYLYTLFIIIRIILYYSYEKLIFHHVLYRTYDGFQQYRNITFMYLI